MDMNQSQKTQSAQAVIEAIESAVLEALGQSPNGIPGGSIYAVLMQFGVRLDLYYHIMDGLVVNGKVVKRGTLYFVK